jgi:cytochrome c peroxidase
MRRNRSSGLRSHENVWARTSLAIVVSIAGLSLGCDAGSQGGSDVVVEEVEVAVVEAPDPEMLALAERATALFGPLPESVPNPDNVGSDAKIDLGRMLYFDKRLSKNHDIACNSCHLLDQYGVDGEPTSPGHRGARGDRNSPTVYNAALHVAQFWDGREPDVEAQAKGPVLNPIEMAASSPEYVVAVLASIPGYVDAFAAAFPDDPEPLDYDNMARAIGAFERNLITPSRFDAFMAGDTEALSETELRGLNAFVSVGCNSCHMGPAVGGTLYRKIGFIFPYETGDPGREKVTGDVADRHVFKVPSLRNVARTGPYFHDGSIATLEEAVKLMGYHQVGVQLEPAQIADIVAFLGSLTGEIDVEYVREPTLPASGPETPAPDPS